MNTYLKSIMILQRPHAIKVNSLFHLIVISTDKKKPHIKKPLNAFMLYMKEMRAKVVAECTLKESAAINQILGRRVSKSFIWVLFRLEVNCSTSE